MTPEFSALLGFGVGAVCGIWAMGLLALGRKRAYVATDEPEEMEESRAPQLVQAPGKHEDIA